jgi:hypothetical protein
VTDEFKALKQNYYHRVACGPFEQPTTQLVPSDIVLHLPVLEFFASRCRHVTEFGVRDGHSTVALVAGCRGKVVSYDIVETPVVYLLRGMALPCEWDFRRADTGSPDLAIDPTDMIFFDTLHTREHLAKELRLHAGKAARYLAFHDTYTCGRYDLSGPDPRAEGILPAIEEFLAARPGQYRVAYETTVNNGLIVYERP